MRRIWLTALCGLALALGLAAPAQGAFDDPLEGFAPFTPLPPKGPPPAGYLNGPCGLAVSSGGGLYVSDYYHRSVDIFSPSVPKPEYSSQPLAGTGTVNPHTGPVDDPCGLALDDAGTLYLNNYHRNVIRFPAPTSLGTGTVLDSGDPADIYANPTGVAVDTASGNVYVNDRTYIAAYDAAGAPLPTPRIGVGTLGDGYGIAVSAFPGSVDFPAPTAGFLYVPDAATDTVKVYDLAADIVNPVDEITGPPGGFGSLEDSAVAVDNVSGQVYVTDTQGPQFTEQPEASIYVFDPTGSYNAARGRLKHNVIDGAPSGLAVDNSAGATQGRVYVTSGITESAGIYAYPPGAATNALLPPIGQSGSEAPFAGGSSTVSAPRSTNSAAMGASATSSAIGQEGNLRVTLSGRLSPRKLPRKGTAPISVSVGGKVSTTDGSSPPELKSITVEINRNGHFDTKGLPLCPVSRIQPASSARALSNCRSSLVGEGSFSALVGFGESEAGVKETYETSGRLLLFNGKKKGKAVLFGQIYSARPFATSFVIPFAVKKIQKGRFGTLLSATLPPSLRSWGNLTGIEMTLSRRYGYQGKSHSYVSAGCPAPKGFGAAVFPLARSTFAFEGGQSLSSTLTDQCKVRG